MVKIGLVGAGNIGQRHIMAIDQLAEAELTAFADPSEAAQQQAASRAIPCYDSAGQMLAEQARAGEALDAVIIATPTERHHADVRACITAGCKTLLVEKPIAADDTEAQDIVQQAERADCQILVAHQRRYYPCAAKAKELIESGAIGTLIGVTGQWSCRKDTPYYAPDWRRKTAAGPVLTNLIHEIDLLRFICGEIKSVSAYLNRVDQNYEKEDAAAICMQFENQAIGTFFLSDRTPSPWSWEFALGENLALPKSSQNSIRFMGSKGALEFPNLVLWQHKSADGHWQDEIIPQPIETDFIDAYVAQAAHLCRGSTRQGTAPDHRPGCQHFCESHDCRGACGGGGTSNRSIKAKITGGCLAILLYRPFAQATARSSYA